MCRYSAYQALQTSAAVTLPGCEKLPGLPAEAAKICKAESAARAGGDINEVAELQRRTDFIEAVRSSANTELEQAEPSWQVLATLVEETTFVQIVRVLDFQWSKLSVNTDESRTQMASAIPNHPAHAYIESFRGDPNLRREYLAQCIRQAREPDLSLTQIPVLRNIRAFALPGRDRYGNLMLMHEDAIVRDLYAGVSYAPDSMRVGLCSEWRRVSPHSPTPIALTIETDWDYAAPFAEEWAKKFSQSARVQLALGRRYFFDKKYPEAIRCLEKSASLDLNIDCSGLLANAWLAQKDENKWKQTWDKFLSEQHPGLLNSQAGVAVARYYMERERFEEALPYAETAANSYASWALTCAGDCLTGLKRYDEANKYFSANRNRYSPGGRVTWYYWQVRNNQGDLQKSLAGILDYLGDANTDAKIAPIDEANVLVLAGKKEQALKIFRQLVVKQPGTYTLWMTAILADDLHDSRNRDVAINMLAERSKLPDTKDQKGLKLAVLCQAALKDPVQLDALPKHMDELLASTEDASERCLMFYLAGKFLANRGRRPQAEAMLRKVANHPFTVAESALAAQELRNWKKGETEGEKKTPEKKEGDQKE